MTILARAFTTLLFSFLLWGQVDCEIRYGVRSRNRSSQYSVLVEKKADMANAEDGPYNEMGMVSFTLVRP